MIRSRVPVARGMIQTGETAMETLSVLEKAMTRHPSVQSGVVCGLEPRSPWDALDRYLRELERSRQVADRYSAALHDDLRLDERRARLHL